MAFVLDPSITMVWAFADESEPTAALAWDLLESGAETAVVPYLWRFEVRNVLLHAERRGRIAADDTTRFLTSLDRIPIVVDFSRTETALLDVARRHKMTLYDAAYPTLAMRENLPLATPDTALGKAATAEGVRFIGQELRRPPG